MAVLEAMFFGLPVIAFDSGALNEVVQTGETGWLVPTGNEEALGAAIRECITNDELRDRYAHAAWSRARGLSDPRGPSGVVRAVIAGMLRPDVEIPVPGH